MKNQYFADTRDLFKYDLILEFLSKSESINHFTFIPMLTENESDYRGGKLNYAKAKAGAQRTELRNFLEACLKENKRDIAMLERFFRGSSLTQKATLTIYKRDEYFSHKTREEYFNEIGEELLTKSVILVDPDTGLEVRSMKGREEKYVRYEEVKMLYDRMDKHSALLIFQFIPRVKRDHYLFKICKKLKREVALGQSVYYISDNQVAFFILVKSPQSRSYVKNLVNNYGAFYNLVVGRR